MKVYIASSWRNEQQPRVVQRLRAEGHDVYDFRHPAPGHRGFQWSEIDENWRSWTPAQFKAALRDPIARDGFEKDMAALAEADAVVLHAAGMGKFTVILLSDGEPELMYAMADCICINLDDVAICLSKTNS